jgi:predicted ester cyclase
MIIEQSMTGTVIGEFLGIPGNNRRITFRVLHVFDFRHGLIAREQVWTDSASVIAQLTS